MRHEHDGRPHETPFTADAAETLSTRRWRTAGLLASVALTATLFGCTAENPSGLPERNAPASASYSTSANPEFYADVNEARRYVPDDKRDSLAEVAHHAVAEWLPPDMATATADVRSALTKSAADGTVPVFVTYAVPDRDLGGHSAGGLARSEYARYVTALSRAIGDGDAVVVVEPDALAQIPAMTDGERDERIGLLARAVDTFAANGRTAVYLDAGNSRWRSPDETAQLLREVADRTAHGIPGIALNVSNYQPTDDTHAYAEDVFRAYGQELYALIDTSRNGAAAALSPGAWCNPTVQRLGTADPLFDARDQFEEAYVKVPGESDGDCGVSDRPAGEFDGDLLVRQLRAD